MEELGIESRTSYMLIKHSTIELYRPPESYFCLINNYIALLEACYKYWLNPQESYEEHSSDNSHLTDEEIVAQSQ